MALLSFHKAQQEAWEKKKKSKPAFNIIVVLILVRGGLLQKLGLRGP